MVTDAVVLTRLEWEGLISRGWLRLQSTRLVRVHDWSDLVSSSINFVALMKKAPDVGISSSDYVLAEINYEIWQPISLDNFDLGKMIRLEQVRCFLGFDERACEIFNANYKGHKKYEVKVFQYTRLWFEWREKIFKASEENRSNRLLDHFGFAFKKANKEFELNFEILAESQEELSKGKNYGKYKGTRSFGWATIFSALKQNPNLSKYQIKLDSEIRDATISLQSDYNVETSFFSGKSTNIANYVFNDEQYAKIKIELIVFAVYAHYTDLIERSGYKKFNYESFCKDIEWLKEKNIEAGIYLIDRIARYMVDELLWDIISSNTRILTLNTTEILQEKTRNQEILPVDDNQSISEVVTSNLQATTPTQSNNHPTSQKEVTKPDVYPSKARSDTNLTDVTDKQNSIEPVIDKDQNNVPNQTEKTNIETNISNSLKIKDFSQGSLFVMEDDGHKASTLTSENKNTTESESIQQKNNNTINDDLTDEQKMEILNNYKKYGDRSVYTRYGVNIRSLKKWAKQFDQEL